MGNYQYKLQKHIDENWDISRESFSKFLYNINSSKYLCLFGAGGVGIDTANYLMNKGFKIDFFCDNNPDLWDKEICAGIKCISLNQLLKYKDDISVLICTRYFAEIYKQLESQDINSVIVPSSIDLRCKFFVGKADYNELLKNLNDLFMLLYDEESEKVIYSIIKNWFIPINSFSYDYRNQIEIPNQYFPSEIISINSNETFVDAGAYDGDTIHEFLIKTNNSFDKIIAYELNTSCFGKLNDTIKQMEHNLQKKINLHNLGVYDSNIKVSLYSNDTSSSISCIGTETGEVITLTEHLKNENVTFIKMDIEGSEVKALSGASELIKRCRPKLAICTYHEPEHLWEIPIYIKGLVSDYKISIRHHSNDSTETVCYAVI